MKSHLKTALGCALIIAIVGCGPTEQTDSYRMFEGPGTWLRENSTYDRSKSGCGSDEGYNEVIAKYIRILKRIHKKPHAFEDGEEIMNRIATVVYSDRSTIICRITAKDPEPFKEMDRLYKIALSNYDLSNYGAW